MQLKFKPLLLIAASLLISISASAGYDNNSEKKTGEALAVAQVENASVLQLTGTVVDHRNNETLAGVSIVVDGKKYYSDLEGNFAIQDVKPGKYELIVELISYEPVSMEIDLRRDEALQIGLSQK